MNHCIICSSVRRLSKRLLISTVVLCTASLSVTEKINAQTTTVQEKKTSVTGRVTDGNNKPLADVSVQLKGTSIGTVTNANGEYKLNFTTQNKPVLVFSFVGMGKQELPVGNRKELNVSLTPAGTQEGEVVVVGFGSQKKAKVIGSVSTIKMDDVLGDRPVSNVAALLQGQIPGLQVGISSGQPTSSPSLNIRGGTDFSTGGAFQNTGPLIVVNDVPFGGSLSLIDPNDIETVTVLKDAGSAAIYGARSAYGVILITTKSGKKNQKPQFNYSNNFIYSTVAPLPKKASPMQVIQELVDGGNVSATSTTWKYLLTDYSLHPENYPGGYAMLGEAYYQLAPTDALSSILGSAAKQQMHNFSVRGGNDKTTYRLSFGATNENGIIVPEAHQDYFKRYNLGTNITTDVTNWMTGGVDFSYNSGTYADPFYQTVASDLFQQISNMSSMTPLDSVPGKGIIASPKYWVMNTAPILTYSNDLRVTGKAILKPFKGLTISGQYNINRANSLKNTYDKYAEGINSGGSKISVGTPGGKYTKANSLTNYNVANVYATYERNFQTTHSFSLMGGFSEESSHSESTTAAKGNLIDANNPSISTGTSATPTADDSYAEWIVRSYFGRFNYDYKAKYLLQVSGRADGSSRFPASNRWGFFPAAELGWRVMQENFARALKPVFSELKLKATYGSVGNQNISNYAYQAPMPTATPSWLNNGAQVTTVNPPSTLISPDFTWEEVTTLDFGVDIAAFHNHLTGSFDWYKRTTDGILTNSAFPLPAVLAIGAPLVNAGALETKGWELELKWQNKIGRNIKYYIGGNLFDYQSVVTKLNTASTTINNLYVNKRMGEIWGYISDRLYTVDDFLPGTLDAKLMNGVLKPGIPKFGSQNPNPGDVLYKDMDGNGVINTGAGTLASPGDRVLLGNSTARLRLGINGGISYKNIAMSFVLVGVGRQEQWILNALTIPNYWAGQSTLYTHQLDYWTPNNPDAFHSRLYTTTGVPVGTGTPAANQQVQSRYLSNTAFLRVKNLSIRYTLPARLLKQAKLNDLSVFFSVEDPWIMDHMPYGVYPDIVRSGSGSGGGQGYPFMRKTSFGLNITF